ncbi:yecA family protein [compost metagenome]
MLRYASEVTEALAADSENFQPLFEESESEEGPVVILEEWCFGYMRGTQVAGWEPLPAPQDQQLKAISLHGLEDNFELLDSMSIDQLQACVPQVIEAARELYGYQKQQRH